MPGISPISLNLVSDAAGQTASLAAYGLVWCSPGSHCG